MKNWSNCYLIILQQIDYKMTVPNNTKGDQPNTQQHEPIFNIAGVIVCLAGAMISIHALLIYVLPDHYRYFVQILFAFNPQNFISAIQETFSYVSAFYYIWTPITHAFLHGDWTHLLLNVGFMLAFGAPVAKRFGAIRFLILFVLCAIGGALFFWLMNLQSTAYLIGSSGAVAGFMGAASRFAFQPNVDETGRHQRGLNVSGPALTLVQCIKDRKFMNFFAIWMVMNILFGTVLSTILGGSGNIAWEAHIGGFLTGIIAFSLLDPRKTSQKQPF